MEENLDIKPEDFFKKPQNQVYAPKLPLALLLESCRSYFTIHLQIKKDKQEKRKSKPEILFLEPVLQDQLIRAVIILYASMPEEEIRSLLKYAVTELMDNPDAIPNIPDLEKLFKWQS